MSRLLLTLAIALPLSAATAAAQSSPVDRAGWMSGCWERRTPTRATTEMWMPPAGGTMLGASRTVAGNATREFEHLMLIARGDTLVYVAVPSGQQRTEFTSTVVSDTALVFENRAHDFPQVIRYWRAGADSLYARVEGPGPNNTSRGFTIPMQRISCTGTATP